MTTLYLLPSTLDELTRTVQDTIVPAMAKAPGFGGMVMLHEVPIGRMLMLELWETEADLAASDSHSDVSIPAVARCLLAGPSQHTVCEVSVHVEVTEQGSTHLRSI